MDTIDASHFLSDQVPRERQALLPPTLKTAYAAVQVLIANEPILQVPSAVDNRGRLISWAVDLGIERLIKSGQWPVECRWQQFEQPTGRYLEVLLSHSRLTISQVAAPKTQPRDVGFRHNARLINDPFLPFTELADDRKIQGLPCFLLVHGHQTLDFTHICVPHPRHHRNYIFRTPNLLLTPHLVASTVPPVEHTEFEDTMTLKEEIEKWRRHNGE